jgi:phage/plasmid-associated DNA primase
MGETNFNEMKQTAIIKRLTGQDLIGFEYKNKDLFEEYNYAKILISTNNLPTTTDKTLGFYRRWLIIDFPHKFSEKKDILADIPDTEYQNLAAKSIDVLHKLLKTKEFNNEGTAEERGIRYEEKSNPFDKFMKEKVVEDADGHIYKFEFKKAIDDWCTENRFRQLTDTFLKQKMKEMGVEDSKITVTEEWHKNENQPTKRYNAWVGISWEVSRGVQDVKGVPLSNTHVNLSEHPLTGMTGLTPEVVIDEKPTLPMEHKSDNYLEKHQSGELFDLEKAIGVEKVKKYLQQGLIFEETPGRYRTL